MRIKACVMIECALVYVSLRINFQTICLFFFHFFKFVFPNFLSIVHYISILINVSSAGNNCFSFTSFYNINFIRSITYFRFIIKRHALNFFSKSNKYTFERLENTIVTKIIKISGFSI